MADRFWVGGTGSWDASSTANWSTTSGGSSGASAPTSADLARFDANSGTGTITLVAGWACGGISVVSPAASLATAGGGTGTITGGMLLSATNFSWGATGNITFAGSGTNTINTNGVTINGGIVINGAGGTWTLQSALTLGGNDNITVTAGTFDHDVYAVSCQLYVGTGTGVRTVDLGSSVVTVGGSGNSWNFANTSNLTFPANTAQLIFPRSAGTQTMIGGGLSYGRVTKDGGSTLVIESSNTIGTLDNVPGSGPLTIQAGTVQTITTWGLNGTSGTPLVISSSSAGVAFTISKASGTVVADYVTLSDCTGDITGGTTYTATNSTDGGGNTNWSFGGGPVTKQIAGTGGGTSGGSGSISAIHVISGTGGGTSGGTGDITGGTGGAVTKQIAGTGGGFAPNGVGDITGGVAGVTNGGFFVINRRRRRA